MAETSVSIENARKQGKTIRLDKYEIFAYGYNVTVYDTVNDRFMFRRPNKEGEYFYTLFLSTGKVKMSLKEIRSHYYKTIDPRVQKAIKEFREGESTKKIKLKYGFEVSRFTSISDIRIRRKI